MKSKTLLSAAVLALLAGQAIAADQVVTIYSADGLHDGHPNWYQTEFDAFTKKTGIKVQYVEGGSGVVVQRVAQEQANPQADVLVTLPPFMQKAAGSDLLQAYKSPEAASIPAADKDSGDMFNPMINNYMNFIYNTKVLAAAPKTYADLLAPKFKSKLQYSTPGQAGDGTAVMLQVVHAMGGSDAGFAYLAKLQKNNVGPSSSTGKLTALVNKGELYVANGDLQMNMAQTAQNPNIRPFWPANDKGQKSTFALPYYIALVKGAPHSENGKKLIDFLLSKEAQSEVSTIAYGLPVRSDVKPTDAHYETMHKLMAGVTVWHPNWDEVAKNLGTNVARWQKATGN